MAEAAFCRLRDVRRIATRHDKLAGNFLSAAALAAAVAFRILSCLNPGPSHPAIRQDQHLDLRRLPRAGRVGVVNIAFSYVSTIG